MQRACRWRWRYHQLEMRVAGCCKVKRSYYGVTYNKRLACIAAVSSDGEANPQVAGLPHAEHTVRIRQRSQGIQENSDLSRGCVR